MTVPSVVREILELGRFPGRYKKPANDTEVRENRLNKALDKQLLKEKQAEDGAAAAKELGRQRAAVFEALPDESTVPSFGQRVVAEA